MFKNYFLLAFRNLRKNKLHTLINLLGMVVAFSCSIFIIMLIYRHFTFDDFQLNKDKIFKVYNYAIGPRGEETGTAMPYPITPALKAENIGVKNATAIFTIGKLVRHGEKTLDMNTTLVDGDFLKMFTFPVIKGDASNPLAGTGNAVLTQQSAQKLFGSEDPIGKPVEVKMEGKWYQLRVSAVVKDFPENSTIKFSVLARTELYPHYAEMRNVWDSRNHDVYVQLAGNTTQREAESRLRSFLKKYDPTNVDLAKSDGYKADKNGDYASLRLLPFTEEHFNTQLGSGGTVNKAFLYVLMLISGVIVLIASFNFVNLNIGLSFTRTREMGVRKCLGAGKKQIWFQVWGESFLMVIISMLMAIGVVVLMIKNFEQVFNMHLSAEMLLRPEIVLSIAGLIFCVSFIASGYPSAVMARLKTVDVLKGKITVRSRGTLRNALIVAQFVMAIVLMCSTVIIFQQFNYLRSAPLGYNTSSMISIPIKNDENGIRIIDQLRTRLASQSSVVAVSGSDVNLGLGKDHSSSTSVMCFTYGDKTICGQVLTGDYDFLKTLGVKPLSGHDFSMEYAADTSAQVIVTRSYAEEFGKKSVAGFSFYTDSTQPPVKIVAVIPDIQIKSLTDKQKPVMIYLSHGSRMNYAWIKVNTTNPGATMQMIQKTYAQIEPGVEFGGSFVDQNIERLYQEEKTLADLFSVAAIIAIVLSCMGLFGIASIVTRQKVKEIGVRKVLGASVGNIFALVGREFVKPVIIAFFLAVPIGWWAMSSWLNDYSHRVPIHWWVFLLAGLGAFAISILTVSFQSVKAARANPVESLRSE